MSILDKLNNMKLGDEVVALNTNQNFKQIHETCLIDLDIAYERPPIVISIGKDPKAYNGVHYPLRFGTAGNISMIKGEEKARKSFLKSLILGCAFGGRSNVYTNSLDISGHNLQDKWIIDIDTEQDEYDSWLNAIRIPKLVGIKPDNYMPLKLREKTPNERLQYVEWLFMESEYKSNLGVVSIDGYVDLINDFNSQLESSELTQKLMKWSSITKSHITGVLHLNPNSDKARGHLGTILQQKCETVVIISDKGEYSLVTCQRGRGKKFSDFCISVNDEWLPEIIDNPEGESWL
tara:strand:- start:47 stop:922 length:876 start_codon:yes stop_codon:yes gene_type:complete